MSYQGLFNTAVNEENGGELAKRLQILDPVFTLWAQTSSETEVLRTCIQKCPRPWQDVETLFIKSSFALFREDVADAFEKYNQMVLAVTNCTIRLTSWVVPVLETVADVLRKMATLDKQNSKENLEKVSRTVNGILKVCLNDRDESGVSKKLAAYYFANSLLRTYFQLHAYSLARGVIKVIQGVSHILPPLDACPVQQQIVFLYYRGVLEFMNQRFGSAAEYLEKALSLCSKKGHKSRETILIYLIPCNLILQGQFPKDSTWEEFPRLREAYYGLCKACRAGNLREYKSLLNVKRPFLVHRHLYLAFAKLISTCHLRLVVQTWKLLGKSNRLLVEDLVRSFEFAGYFDVFPDSGQEKEVQLDAVELIVANLIYSGQIKGYIGHAQRTVVLSNQDPFPNLIRPKKS